MNILQVFTTIFMLVMSYLSVSLPLNGLSTKDISDQLFTYLTPAGFTFSIWSIIYIGVIAISIALIMHKVVLPRKAMIWFMISSLANGLWIVAWHYQNLHLAMIIILVLLASLIIVDRSIVTAKKTIAPWVRTVFLTYFGRVQIATLLMTTIYLQYQLHWIEGITIQAGIVVLILAGISNFYVLSSQKHAATTLVACRALRGIIQWQTESSIVNTSYVVLCILAIALLTFLPAYIKKRRK